MKCTSLINVVEYDSAGRTFFQMAVDISQNRVALQLLKLGM